ncbi:MAG: MBL fold metallo-hydrolase [Lachnospiraceae bacterium]|nr:MBL fold metallo-hydrolase [Lachnospiraceae bacterium]
MRIVNLVENTEGASGCEYAHGLSFYIETEEHKILMDSGPNDITIRNAQKLGIDLTAVDTLILSHGHYDHGGGIISFAKINPNATIYMQDCAFGEYYADDGEDKGKDRYRYIGIEDAIKELPQLRLINGNTKIDDELSVFTVKKEDIIRPATNNKLKIKQGRKYVQDDFKHEHYLVVRTGHMHILISGCAHNGILNILDEYRQIYREDPDAVISGFHLMKKSAYTDEEILDILDIAKALTKSKTKFYTCHCTGVLAYEMMKRIMGDKLVYVHSGDEIDIEPQKTTPGRSAYMKGHKFFAWATVVCFVMTMITGYKKK